MQQLSFTNNNIWSRWSEVKKNFWEEFEEKMNLAPKPKGEQSAAEEILNSRSPSPVRGKPANLLFLLGDN